MEGFIPFRVLLWVEIADIFIFRDVVWMVTADLVINIYLLFIVRGKAVYFWHIHGSIFGGFPFSFHDYFFWFFDFHSGWFFFGLADAFL